ncbi:heavy metal translocating P-type ATPase [Gordonia neofelifaecis]|uniref:Copper/silver-translocating P-type ATPase n=1 Tax=Gordonia neofelifaecis NRRL B-59395 TaxID=644548 RepID=F1YP67_9ACTN|nr:heavy metal translocating P-type ATPase [Gordonia neofelifaecis]EGD53516.1 copper/silver-translocating P-type ATPase [Gordonia neofelifaecis NRRL B-59395]
MDRHEHDAHEHATHDGASHEHSAHEHSAHEHGGHEHGGHATNGDAHHGGDHVAVFRRLFWGTALIAIPVVGFDQMFASLLGYDVPAWGRWISPVLGSVIYRWGGRPFLTGAVSEIRMRKPGMMLLIGLAISVAFVSSWGSSLGLLSHELSFWWELALLVVIMLLGHWIEMASLAQTTSALDSLAALLPDEAEVVDGAGVRRVAPAELRLGDVVLVRPGSSIPADGVVVEGSASVDESMVTGESRSVRRSAGDAVVAGTVATDSGLRVEVTAVGDQTTLAGIARLVADAQASSSNAQRLADRAAGWLFWFAIGSATLTAIVWMALGMPDTAVVRVITVLVIACPHALGLAIPLVVSIATERAARGGVLVKDRLALERMRSVDTVLFDKTGTLTEGAPSVVGVEPAAGRDANEILALAAAAEVDSEHPLAKAIVEAAVDRGLVVPVAAEFTSEPATGVRAVVDDRRVEVGGPRMLALHASSELPVAERWRTEGAIILHVVVDGEVAGALKLADDVRPESRDAVDALHRLGVSVVMITGDARAVADTVASELGIDRVYAEVRPEDKAEAVAELQAEGRVVAMVGDGVNDAPALARADVGIAIGAGTDVAIASAGVILASSDPRSVLSVVELSRAGYRKMKQNLWWAAGYNLVSVPLAAGVLAPIGFVMPMSVGAILMSVSTVVVALNSQRLRRLDLDPAAGVDRILGDRSRTPNRRG